jgi:MFS transporter, PAT family, beta-lactamase induction signal transducer AmpG
MDRAGDRAALWVSILSVSLAMLLLAFVASLPMAYLVAVYFGIAFGASQAIYFALAMKYTLPSIAASMYAILMAVTNLGQGIGLALGGILADQVGYAIAFLLFGAAMFLILPFFPVIFRSGQISAVADQT